MLPALRRSMLCADWRAFAVLWPNWGFRHNNGTWRNSPIATVAGMTITVGSVPAAATRVRFLWYNNPCGAAPYGCPVYTRVAPIGSETGEMAFLPLGPFIMDLPPPGAIVTLKAAV